MSKININANVLKESIAKLSGFIGETIVLELTTQKNEEGQNLAKIKACNGVAQAVAMLTYGGDAVESKLIFTNQFNATVDALSAFGEELAVEILEGKCRISSGTATADVSCVPECKEIDAPNFAQVPTIVLGLSKDLFRRAVLEGGYINEKCGVPAYSQTCILQPVVEKEDKPLLKVYSCSGPAYAESMVPVGINPETLELYKKFAEKQPVIVKSGPLLTIAKSLKTDVVIYMTEKFLFLVTESVAYSFLPVAASAGLLDKLLSKRADRDFAATLNKEQVHNAFKVCGLNAAAASNEALFANIKITELEDGRVDVLVSDINGTNNVTITGEGSGNHEMAVRKSDVIRTLDNMSGDNATIYGTAENRFFFLQGDNPAAFAMDCNVDLSELKK